MRPLRHTFAPLLAALVVFASPLRAADAAEILPGSAEATKEASARFQSGVAFFKDGEYQAALLEFKRAYELSPNYRVLYNLGQTSRELKDHASALTSFERYLAEGGREIDVKRKRDVDRWMQELRPKVARMAVVTTVAGAEITVDDLPAGTTPLPEPLRVNAGRRKVQATLAGHQPVQRFIDLAGADDLTVTLELFPNAPPPSPPPVVPPPTPPPREAPPPPPPRGSSSWPWVGLATTGALATATVMLGIRALDAQSDLEETLDRQTDAAAIQDARGDAQGFALATDILGGVTLAAAATTVVLFIVTADGDDAQTARARVRVAPNALVAEGAF